MVSLPLNISAKTSRERLDILLCCICSLGMCILFIHMHINYVRTHMLPGVLCPFLSFNDGINHYAEYSTLFVEKIVCLFLRFFSVAFLHRRINAIFCTNILYIRAFCLQSASNFVALQNGIFSYISSFDLIFQTSTKIDLKSNIFILTNVSGDVERTTSSE